MHVHTCATPGAGNPPLVIENDRSRPDTRQSFARKRDTNCGWIDPPQDGGVAAVVDCYYAHTQPFFVTLCHHLAE